MNRYYITALLILISFLVAIPIYNSYFRPQVYLVAAQVGSDSSPTPTQSPSNLAALQAVATKYNATIATQSQVASAAAAGAQWLQWGWMNVNGFYLAAFPYSTGNVATSDMALALGCPSQTAMLVNPCLNPQVGSTSPACNQTPPGRTYSYNSTTQVITCNGGSCDSSQSFACSDSGVIHDIDILGTSQNYVVNPSTGVLLYGIKPRENSDPAVIPFNASQYSQYSAFSL